MIYHPYIISYHIYHIIYHSCIRPAPWQGQGRALHWCAKTRGSRPQLSPGHHHRDQDDGEVDDDDDVGEGSKHYHLHPCHHVTNTVAALIWIIFKTRSLVCWWLVSHWYPCLHPYHCLSSMQTVAESERFSRREILSLVLWLAAASFTDMLYISSPSSISSV